MQLLSHAEVLDSFERRYRKLVALPRDFNEVDWNVLDFLGWIDVGTARGFIVAEHRGDVRGLVFQRGPSSDRTKRRAHMCSLCKTIHGDQGVRTFTVRHHRNANRTLSNEYCDDLRCSLRVRGLISLPPNQMPETLSAEEKALRLQLEVEQLFDRCLK